MFILNVSADFVGTHENSQQGFYLSLLLIYLLLLFSSRNTFLSLTKKKAAEKLTEEKNLTIKYFPFILSIKIG